MADAVKIKYMIHIVAPLQWLWTEGDEGKKEMKGRDKIIRRLPIRRDASVALAHAVYCAAAFQLGQMIITLVYVVQILVKEYDGTLILLS